MTTDAVLGQWKAHGKIFTHASHADIRWRRAARDSLLLLVPAESVITAGRPQRSGGHNARKAPGPLHNTFAAHAATKASHMRGECCERLDLLLVSFCNLIVRQWAEAACHASHADKQDEHYHGLARVGGAIAQRG